MTIIDLIETFFLGAIPFGVFMGLFFIALHGLHQGIAEGVASGLCFGLFITIFVLYQSNKFKSNLSLGKDEKLIKEGGANHFVWGQATGGWLYLTNKRLIFRSHSVNIAKEEFSIYLNKIKEVKICMSLKIVPNGLSITTIDGGKEQFVVFGRRHWVKDIISAKKKISVLS